MCQGYFTSNTKTHDRGDPCTYPGHARYDGYCGYHKDQRYSSYDNEYIDIDYDYCNAITRRNRQCNFKAKYNAMNGNSYCGIHIKKYVGIDKIGLIYLTYTEIDGKIRYPYIGQTLEDKPEKRIRNHVRSWKNTCGTKAYRNIPDIKGIKYRVLQQNISTHKMHSVEQNWMDKFNEKGYKLFLKKFFSTKRIEQNENKINNEKGYKLLNIRRACK